MASGEPPTGTVSLRAEVPQSLLDAMRGYIEAHPNWDQYRLFQAALAGFLVQNGVRDREVTRCYLASLFPGQGRFTSAPSTPSLPPVPPGAPASGPPLPPPPQALPLRASASHPRRRGSHSPRGEYGGYRRAA
jgi:hypothetical protein